MIDMLKVVGRKENLVGWYHSHPGFGCWLSMTDITTQKSYEGLERRAVALVIDPIQSVKGRVVMECFRAIHANNIVSGTEPRITTSNTGCLFKPTFEARIRGVNKL